MGGHMHIELNLDAEKKTEKSQRQCKNKRPGRKWEREQERN